MKTIQPASSDLLVATVGGFAPLNVSAPPWQPSSLLAPWPAPTPLELGQALDQVDLVMDL